MVKFKSLVAIHSYVVIFAFGQTADYHRCDLPLGMQDRAVISDAAITSSVGNDARKGRLNGAGAWCFKEADLSQEQDKATLTVDLGQLTFVSGVQTQGPPLPLANQSYYHHVGFKVKNSTSENATDLNWGTCCGATSMLFFSNASGSSSAAVKTHAFDMLLLARRLQFSVDMKIRWPGSEERKCFRFEVLGCQQELSPLTNLKLEALASGWIEATWQPPSVMVTEVTGAKPYELNTLYNATLSWTEVSVTPDITNSTTYELNERRLLIPGPIWGARYSLSLICPHQGVSLPCGDYVVNATVQGCDPDQQSCQMQNQVTFRRPEEIQSWTIRPNTPDSSAELAPASDVAADTPTQSVFLGWKADGAGWVTTATVISVKNSEGDEVVQRVITDEIRSIFLENLEGTLFTVTFTPQVTSLVHSSSFTYELHIIEWSSLESAPNKVGFGSFITDVKLEANIQWEGNLIVTWTPALVREGDFKTYVNDTNVTVTVQEIENEYSAPANKYNVTLMEENEEASLLSTSVAGDEVFKARFSFVKMETTYNINISCDYGGVIVQCGFSTVYTALPIAMTQVGSQPHIYVGRAGGEKWSKQEESCRNGEGHLITFGSQEEEDLIRPFISTYMQGNFKSFWIGLNMCRGSTGNAWSDGSKYIYSLLPQMNSGLTQRACCIKASWAPEERVFTWNGDLCHALLPAICEYQPSGLVGAISSLSRRNATSSSASYDWTYAAQFWSPSHFKHTICPVRNLTTFRQFNSTQETKCTVELTPFESDFYMAENLTPFTEYNVTVAGALSSLQYAGKNRSTILRTYHTESVILQIFKSGFLDIIWADKISNFEETDLIHIVLTESSAPTENRVIVTAAKQIRLSGIQLGGSYNISLEETTGLKKEYRTLVAYPPCKCTECQNAGRCLMPSDRQVSSSVALSQCLSEDMTLAVSKSEERLGVLLAQAENMLDDLWVSSSSLKGTGVSAGASSTVTASSVDTSTETSEVQECLLVSRSAKAVVAVADCKAVHFAACEQKPPIPTIFPPPDKIRTEVGGSWLRLDWPDADYGWKIEYTIYYQRALERRYKRAIKYENFDGPPVLIENLEKSTSYSVELIASLAEGFLASSEEFVRTTSSSSAKFEVENTKDTAVLLGQTSSSWMLAGWSPSSDYYLAQLVCGTFLIAVCISTMLLFFATGMFYQDCMAQLGFLFCLLVAYLLLLVAHPRYLDDNLTFCIVVSAILHYFFLCSFMFLGLEALTISHLLVDRVQSPFQNSNWSLMLTGFILPAIYVCICAGVINNGYTNKPRHNCWLNVEGVPLYVEVVPNALLLVLTIVFTFLTVRSNEDNQPILKDTDIRGRQSDSYKLRWVVLVLSVELSVAWASGTAAYHLRSPECHSVFNAFTLLLALTILIARTWLDDTFRSKLHRLCCGTELTYKKSAMHRVSGGGTKVAPMETMTNRDGTRQRTSSGFSTTTVSTMTTTAPSDVPSSALPNTPPPPEELSNTILIKRSYKFEDDDDDY